MIDGVIVGVMDDVRVIVAETDGLGVILGVIVGDFVTVFVIDIVGVVLDVCVAVGVIERVVEELDVGVGLDDGHRNFSQIYTYTLAQSVSRISVAVVERTQSPVPFGSPVLQ